MKLIHLPYRAGHYPDLVGSRWHPECAAGEVTEKMAGRPMGHVWKIKHPTATVFAFVLFEL
jgi:hypothetical protein